MRPSLTGVVVSQGKMAKTVKIQIKKVKWNSVVSKYVTNLKTMLVHDELDKCREGDVVRIQYVRPLSARKSWAVAEIMKLKGTSWQKYQQRIPKEVERDELAKLDEFIAKRDRLADTKGTDSTLDALRAEILKNSQAPATEVDLEVLELQDQLEALQTKVDNTEALAAEARRLLAEEPDKADELVRTRGKDPAELKQRVKRNIVLRALQEQNKEHTKA